MILDGRKLKANAKLDYDICIVGSGPAGITLALELADSKKRICVLEAGGHKASKSEINEFLSGENVGLPYKLEASRSRQFGGTSDQWQGYLAIMDALDFKENKKIPLSGWPISHDELLPYYARAFKLFGENTFEFDPDKFTRPQYERIKFKSEEVTSKIWHFDNINFAEKFGKALAQSTSIHVYLNAALTRIHLNQAGNRASHLTVATSERTGFTVRAGVVVLACGGLENARVLLAQKQQARTAFDNDNIGRYFMDHPHYKECANLMLFGKHADSKLYDLPARELRVRKSVCTFFQIGSEIREKLGLPNAAFRIHRPVFPIKQYTRIAMTLKGLYRGDDRVERLSRITVMTEQFPNAASRVSLADKVDKYGMPKIRLNWQLTPAEIKKFSQSMNIFTLKLGENGLGRLQVEEWLAKNRIISHIGHGYHHMGTTRMAHTANDGAVDAHGRMFGLDNLFVAGSSVFPTSSCVNPTFTILVLTVRLADHLKAKNG